MSDQTATNPEAANPEAPVLPVSGTEGTWDVAYMIPRIVAGRKAGATVNLTLNDELVRQEIVDQCDIKKPARTAILRATQKRLAKAIKLGAPIDKPAADDERAQQDYEALRWDSFILLIDELIAGKHVKLRDDDAAIDALMTAEKLGRA